MQKDVPYIFSQWPKQIELLYHLQVLQQTWRFFSLHAFNNATSHLFFMVWRMQCNTIICFHLKTHASNEYNDYITRKIVNDYYPLMNIMEIIDVPYISATNLNNNRDNAVDVKTPCKYFFFFFLCVGGHLCKIFSLNYVIWSCIMSFLFLWCNFFFCNFCLIIENDE